MSGKLPIYRFIVEIGVLDPIETSPIYGDGVKVIQKRESNEMYFRRELSGVFKFIRGDFDAIFDVLTLEDEATFTIEEFTGTWDLVAASTFSLTDCEVDRDRRILTVKMNPGDDYSEILATLDKEFDLVALDVPRTELEIALQPVVQVYFPGANFVNNFLNGSYWEQPVIEPLGVGPFLESLFPGQPILFAFVIGDSSVLDPDISGHYFNDPFAPYFGYTRSDGQFALTYDFGLTQWKFVEYATGITVYLANSSGPTNDPPPGYNWTRTNNPVTFISQTTASECKLMFSLLYARVLTNAEEIAGNPTVAIPSPDIVEDNLNYSRMMGIDVTEEMILGSCLHNPTAGRFGKFADDAFHFAGEYFVKPSGAGVIYPVNRSEWTEVAVWFRFTDEIKTIQETGSVTRILKDAFKMSDVLSAILSQIDTTVTHDTSTASSLFFYDPANPIRGDLKTPMITPKSNIVVGEYDKPANKAPITLTQIFTFFRQAYNVFWYVDGGKLRFEHLKFFESGGSYSADLIGTDLTTLIEPKTGKNWSFKTDRWTYDKPSLWQIKRFKWMDSVSRPFEGYPIETAAKYVERGRVDEMNLTPFTSDVDFIQIQPAGISKDGFVFFEAVDNGSGGFKLPFVEFAIDAEEEYKIQNGFAAMTWAVDAYHRERLPSLVIRINDREDEATSVVRMRKQEVFHPGVVDPVKLVKTLIGNGRVVILETDLSTRMNKVTLLHDVTESPE